MSKKSEKKETAEAEAGPEPAEQAGQAGQAEQGEAKAQPEQPAAPTAEQTLKAELEKEKALAEDYKRKWYLVSAEYENYRKRTASQSALRYREGRADVIAKLFPVGDNLERALASCSDEATKKGLQMVLASYEKLLQEEKIEVIDPLGQPFDAERHEAIMAVDAAEGEESGTVKQVYLKGYAQDGKVLRFAQVMVVK